MRLQTVMLALLISLLLSGCASVVLRPILKEDLVPMDKGVAYAPDRAGWFLSDAYMKEVGVVVARR